MKHRIHDLSPGGRSLSDLGPQGHHALRVQLSLWLGMALSPLMSPEGEGKSL